jgi:hypothetical protein
VTRPPIWLKLMSTTMLSTRHFSNFTCSHCKQHTTSARVRRTYCNDILLLY